MNKPAPSTAALEKMRNWREHPSAFVREVFKVEPDAWQHDVLEAFPHNQRMALKSCKGPGKSALLAWIGWNYLATRPHPKIAATSITSDTLADTLWAEMAKWRNKSQFLINAFEWQKTRIFSRENPETWFMSARSWSKSAAAEQQADTLAGLHADYILFLIDEAGGIPDSVMAAAEAALASCIEGHLVIAGNPTHREGPLYRACTREKRLWHVTEITGDPDDPKRSPRISVEWARQQIEKYGRESPWVLVNVFGQFPPGSINALIGPEEIEAAQKRLYTEFDLRGTARLLGVDVARMGDDSSVIFPRQGRQAFTPIQFRNLDSIQGAAHVARKWNEWDADACFIDNSGGFGSGWIDQLRVLGKDPVPVDYSVNATDGQRYFNKRAEMYFEAVQWIKEGGALPICPELLAALTVTTYTFRGSQMLLEPKDAIKEKLGYSPDHADAFVETFHSPVTPKPRGRIFGVNSAAARAEYDPYASVDAAAEMFERNR